MTLFYEGTLQTALAEPIKWIAKLGLSMLFIDKVAFPSLWYMTMILCVYLVLPIFCVYLSHFSLKSLRLPIAIVFVSGFIAPTINKFLAVMGVNWGVSFELEYAKIFSYFLVFVFCGYYISGGGLKQKANRFIWFNFSLWFTLTVIYQLFGYSRPYNLITEYTSIGILFSSVFLFELIRRYENNLCRYSRSIIFLFKYSFGIYMVHTFVIWTLHKMMPTIWLNRPFTVLSYTVIATITSIVAVYILTLFKCCRKYLLNIK